MGGTHSRFDHAAIRDWSVTTPSTAVLEAVAAASDRSETELETLYDALDPDALDSLVAGNEATSVSFRYAGYETTVAGDGTVTVRRER